MKPKDFKQLCPLTIKQSLLGVVIGCMSCIGAILLYAWLDEPAFLFAAGMEMYFMANCMDEYFFQKRISAASSKEVSCDD